MLYIKGRGSFFTVPNGVRFRETILVEAAKVDLLSYRNTADLSLDGAI